MLGAPNTRLSFGDGWLNNLPENEFLEKVKRVIDFDSFREKFKKLYAEGWGRPGYDPVMLFKIVLLQQWYNLSDRSVIAEVSDRISFRRFLGIGFGEPIPDDTTLVRFRNRLEEGGVYNQLITMVEAQLESKGYCLKEGRMTIVDATLVKSHTRPRSCNPDYLKQREPEAETTRREKKLHCGYKLHMSLDAETELIRAVKLTGSRQNEVNELLNVIPPGTRAIYADKGYHSASNRTALKELDIEDMIMYRAARGHPLTPEKREFNKKVIPIRSAIERKFGELKLWHRLGRAIYWGLNRVYRQVVLAALAVNLKRCVVLCA